MGHTRLGTLPKTRKWQDVIACFASITDVAAITSATVKAAGDSLQLIKNDIGFKEAAWLLNQISIAGTQENPLKYLSDNGIIIKEPTLLGLIAAVSEKLDSTIHDHREFSTQCEIAGNALTSAILKVMEPILSQRELFDSGKNSTEFILKQFGSAKTFDHLSREFFFSVANQSLNFFISQETSSHIGEGLCFVTANQEQQFTDAIETHVHECSKITEGYGEGWFAKHHFQEKDAKVTRDTVQGFAAFGIEKMIRELKHEGEPDNAK